MADIQFLRLSDRWALAYDTAQWIVQRRKSFDKRRGKWNWEGVSFVASNRDTLLRVLREEGAKIDPDKLEEVHALPYEFKTWIELQKGRKRGFKGCDSGISAPEVVRWSPGIGASHTHFCESGKLADNVKTVSRCSGRPNTLSDGSMAEPKE